MDTALVRESFLEEVAHQLGPRGRGARTRNSRFREQSIPVPQAHPWGPQPGPDQAPPWLREAIGTAGAWGTGRKGGGGEGIPAGGRGDHQALPGKPHY